MTNEPKHTIAQTLSIGLKVLENSKGLFAVSDASGVLLTDFSYTDIGESRSYLGLGIYLGSDYHTDRIYINRFIDGLAILEISYVERETKEYCFINNKGELIGSPNYSAADEFKNGLAFVKKYTYNTCINKFGIEVFPSNYNIQKLDDKYIYAKVDDKMVLMDYQLKTIFDTELNYSHIDEIQDDIFKVKVDNRYYKIVGVNDIKLPKEVTELNFDLLETTNLKNVFRVSFRSDRENQNISNKYFVNIFGDKFDEYGKLRGSRILVRIKDKFGYADETGKLVIKAKFDFAASFYNGLAVVKQGNLCYLINNVGKKIKNIDKYDKLYKVESRFDEYFEHYELQEDRKSNNLSDHPFSVIGVIKDNKEGLIDLNGNVIIEPLYDYRPRFGWVYDIETCFSEYHENAIIRKDGKYGLIDLKGNNILDPQYQEKLVFENGMAIAKKDDLYGIVSNTGRIMKACECKSITRLPEGNYLYSVENNSNEINYGLLNIEGELISKPIYSCFEPLHNNYIVCIKTENSKLYGTISEEGKVMIPINQEQIISYKEKKSELIVKKDNLYGVFSEYGEEIIPVHYDEIIFKGYFGNEIIEEYLYDNDNNKIHRQTKIDRFLVNKKKLLGVFNGFGKEIIATKYDDIIYHPEIHLFQVSKENQSGALSESGEEIIPICYDEMRLDYYINEFIVKKNELFGIVDRHGNEKIPIKYLLISEFSDGLAIIQDQNMKYGYIDYSCSIVIPIKYDEAKDFSYGCATVVLNGKESKIKYGKHYSDESMWTDQELRDARNDFLSGSQYDPNDGNNPFDPYDEYDLYDPRY